MSYGEKAAPLTLEQVNDANTAQLALATGWTLEYIDSLDMRQRGVMIDVMRFNDDKVRVARA